MNAAAAAAGASSPAVQAALEKALKHGETVLWTGHPSPARVAQRYIPVRIFLAVFTAIGLLILANMLAATLGDPAHTAGSLMAVIALMAPLPLLAMWFQVALTRKARASGDILYAVTDHRVLVITPGTGEQAASIEHYQPRPELIRCRELPDGSGDLRFAVSDYRFRSGTRATFPDEFLGIPDVRRVEALLREAFPEKAHRGGGDKGSRTGADGGSKAAS
jgi:hypothetical protein